MKGSCYYKSSGSIWNSTVVCEENLYLYWKYIECIGEVTGTLWEGWYCSKCRLNGHRKTYESVKSCMKLF